MAFANIAIRYDFSRYIDELSCTDEIRSKLDVSTLVLALRTFINFWDVFIFLICILYINGDEVFKNKNNNHKMSGYGRGIA